MFFRTIDKFFVQLKYLISVVTFLFIAMASILFIYWLLYSAKITLPDPIVSFVWGTIEFVSFGFKNTKAYSEITDILPALASGVFIILTYFTNCIMLFLDNNHQRFQNSVKVYRKNVEQKINKELYDAFIDDLKKISYMLVKIKVDVEVKSSYLNPNINVEEESKKLQKEISNEIISSIPPELVAKKAMEKDSIYFLITNFEAAREFFTVLVAKSAQCINQRLKDRTSINFNCGADVFDNLDELNGVSTKLDKILSLKLPNKIVVCPKFKLYFDNIYSNSFSFSVLGEYNINVDRTKIDTTLLHSLHRRN